MAMKNNCVFCAMAAGEIPCFKVYEDETAFACLDINPFSEGHVLVIPKVHVANLLEADEALVSAMAARARKVAAHVQEVLGCDGFNLLQNNGAAAGQSVNHLHFHIIPRRSGDPLVFENRKGDMAALAALAERLKM